MSSLKGGTDGYKEKDNTYLCSSLPQDPSLFINRELSWVRFNYRVLEEAMDPSHPLLERVKFLAICGSNLDEFFMTRVSSLERQLAKHKTDCTPDGMTPLEQLEVTRSLILPLMWIHYECLSYHLIPSLIEKGISICNMCDLDEETRNSLRNYVKTAIVPKMSPPQKDLNQKGILNLHIYILVHTRSVGGVETTSYLEMPTDIFGRLIDIDRAVGLFVPSDTPPCSSRFVFLEDLLASNLDLIYKDANIQSYYFRMTRDAEIDIVADDSSDFLITMKKSLKARRMGNPSRLEVSSEMPIAMVETLSNSLGVPFYAVYSSKGPLGLVDLWQLLRLDRPDLKDKSFVSYIPEDFAPQKDPFLAISMKDRALYHPYDSFEILVHLLDWAAKDPQVTSIDITLYRIDSRSPVVSALMDAARNGKRVTALVELKAKFDEENNIKLVNTLKEAGVETVYNFRKIKVHAKLCLICRNEDGRIKRYSHIGSGNYNSVTSKIYGDIGYLTGDDKVGEELQDLFNSLKNSINIKSYQYLLVSPTSLKDEILKRIEREIAVQKANGGGYLGFKLNGLVDHDIIMALYEASRAGVKIELNVRGLCCLRPGVQGISDNITITSIVGRFLEHARIYYFRNGGDEELLIGSSDLMPRNLEKRVEVLFSVPNRKILRAILQDMLMVHLRDNTKARRLNPDGTYSRVSIVDSQERFNSQNWLIENRGAWHDKY